MGGTAKKAKRNVAGDLIFLAVFTAVAWYVLLYPLGPIRKEKAVGKVEKWAITVNFREGAEQRFLRDLIFQYDIDERTVVYRESMVDEAFAGLTKGPLKWDVNYVNGKYVLGYSHDGRLYSFETDLINVTPVSEAAQAVFDLPNVSFTGTKTEPLVPLPTQP